MSGHAHLLLRSNTGKIMFSTLDPVCISCVENCPVGIEVTDGCGHKGRRRRGLEKSATGSWFLCTNDPDLLNSNRKFKQELSGLAIVLEAITNATADIERKHTDETKRLAHNVEKLNAHILQEIYALVPQEELALCLGKRKQVDLIADKIADVRNEVAEGILRVLKNSTGIKTEFSVFSKLRKQGFPLDIRKHAIHRVVLNATSTFFSDLSERGITFEISPCLEQVSIDYESCLVALNHLLDNSAKYCKGNSRLKVEFAVDGSFIAVRFLMTSLHVPEPERQRLFEEGFSSSAAQRLAKAGDGLGLFTSRKLLEMNRGGISFVFGSPERSSINIKDHPYSENVIEIRLPRAMR
jgi:signal transduction histidine kinase